MINTDSVTMTVVINTDSVTMTVVINTDSVTMTVMIDPDSVTTTVIYTYNWQWWWTGLLMCRRRWWRYICSLLRPTTVTQFYPKTPHDHYVHAIFMTYVFYLGTCTRPSEPPLKIKPKKSWGRVGCWSLVHSHGNMNGNVSEKSFSSRVVFHQGWSFIRAGLY